MFSCKAKYVAVEDDSFIIADGLPCYYTKEYMTEKCNIVNNSLKRSDGINDSFVFITDTHLEWNSCYSGKLISTVLSNTPVSRVIHGGDAGSELTRDYQPIGFDLLYENIEKLSTSLVEEVKTSSFYSVRGNHDFSCKINDNDYDGFPISQVKSTYLSFMPGVISDETDDDGLYYYFDNPVAKIRYIAIDTSYGSIIGTARLGYRQLEWILENAIKTTPDDYSMVLLSHIPISLGVDITTEYVRFKPLKEIISAINNKRSGTVICEGQELKYDFTSTSNSVLFVLSGHVHSDSQAFEDNVIYITTTCDRLSNDMVSQYEESYRQFRVFGDISEQAFDVVSFNNVDDGWIMMTRIGAGYSRFFNKKVVSLRIGETIDLSECTTFIDPQSWDANDAPGAIGSWVSRNWTRSLTVLDISDDRITTLREGEAMVFAEDKEHNKEFFLVKVLSSN